MEEVFGSECSSGCESGWTLYLEHSMYPSHSLQNHNNVNNHNDFICKKALNSFTNQNQEEEEEEEDMSMVSDASSGPPHFQEHEDECFNNNNNGGFYPTLPALIDNSTNGKGHKIRKEPNLHRKVQDLPSFLDDTASSPFFNFSNKNVTASSMEVNDIIDYSQGYSTTYFEGKSTFQEHFGFYHTSVSGTHQLQQNQWFEGKRWG